VAVQRRRAAGLNVARFACGVRWGEWVG